MIRIGIIGAGKWGKNHVRVQKELDLDDVEFIGIADPNPAVKELIKDKKHYHDYKEMLDDVDAVIIATPTNTHYKIVKDCLVKGKHVFVEKPITLEAEKARELKQLARDRNLLCQVGYIFRYNAAVNELKKQLKDIGKIHYITGRYIHSTKPPRKDCGVIFNFGIHLIDILNHILEKRPKKVYCDTSHYLSEEREDVAFINLNYGDVVANLEMSWLHPLKKRDFWIIGEKYKLYIDILDQKMTKFPIEISYEQVNREEEQEIKIQRNNPLKDEVLGFINSIRNNRGVEMKEVSEEEYITTKICELCYESAKQGKELDFQ